MTTIVPIKHFVLATNVSLPETVFWTVPAGKIAKVKFSSIVYGINSNTNTGEWGSSSIWINEGAEGVQNNATHRTYVWSGVKASGYRATQGGIMSAVGYTGSGNTSGSIQLSVDAEAHIKTSWGGATVNTHATTPSNWMPEVIMTEGEELRGEAYYQYGASGHWMAMRGLAYLEDIST